MKKYEFDTYDGKLYCVFEGTVFEGVVTNHIDGGFNGPIIVTVGSLSVPHKGYIVNKVIEGSFQIIDGSHAALEKSHEWQHLQLTDGEQQALAEPAHLLRFADAEGKVTTPIAPAQLLSSHRYGDQGSDLWRTFNHIQENAIRGGLHGFQRDANSRIRRVTTRQIKGTDHDVRLNRALWMLAERMAELKTAA